MCPKLPKHQKFVFFSTPAAKNGDPTPRSHLATLPKSNNPSCVPECSTGQISNLEKPHIPNSTVLESQT